MFTVSGEQFILVQLRPDLREYYKKYCDYYVDMSTDMAWGKSLKEPGAIIELEGIGKATTMSLAEWAKRKLLCSCTVFRGGGHIGPANGREGDVVAVILCYLTFGMKKEAEKLMNVNRDLLNKIAAIGDMEKLIGSDI